MRTLSASLGLLAVLVLLAGCAPHVQDIDYTAYRRNQPRSILVLPPLNNTPDVQASYAFLATVTQPLAEAGYYVFPVALVDQTFRENGLPTPADMHQAPLGKLREIFGADATLFITVTQYGSIYTLVNSEIRVTADAKLVDNRSGDLLWSGSATASDSEGNNGGGGLLEALVYAVVKQIVSNVGDQTYPVARKASDRLLAVRPNGLLYGPRSPYYETTAQ